MANRNTRVYWLHALTPLHVGCGSGAGFIDLPIMREKVTRWPLVPGSAVKGVLADSLGASNEDRQTNAELAVAFGRAGDEDAFAGALVFTDARIVCLPVRSLYGTFAWCTSPLALRRLRRDLLASGIPDVPAEPPQIVEGEAHVAHSTALQDERRKVYLEDLDVTARPCPVADAWAQMLGSRVFVDGESATWRSTFAQRFGIVSDAVFDFLCETGTEVAARVAIDQERKAVKKGALWYEESLPAETILCGLVWCDRVRRDGIDEAALLQKVCRDSVLQIGGKASVGKGRVRCLFTTGSTAGGGSHG